MSVKDDVAQAVQDMEGYNRWVTIDCVVCDRASKMRVCLDENDPRFSYYQCWSPSCGVRGFFGAHHEHDTKKPAEKRLVSASLPEHFEPLSTKSGGVKQRRLAKFRTYLYNRGVSQFLIDECNLGCVPDGKLAGMVVIPYYKNKEIIGWVGRSIYKKRYHYPDDWPKTQWPYNGDELFVESEDPAIVVEGQFDAINLWPFGVGVGGQPTEEDWALMLSAKRPLVMAFDADEGTKSEYGSMKLMLLAMRKRSSAKFAWMKLPPGTDPGGHDREKFLTKAFAIARNK